MERRARTSKSKRLPRILREIMERDGVTQLELSQRLGHNTNGLVSRILAGARTIPMDSLLEWTRALRLAPTPLPHDGEYEHFVEAALADAAPDAARLWRQARDAAAAAVRAQPQR